MTIKSFYTLLLSATTVILASCSTETADERSATTGSETRPFVITEVQKPMTRTNISITKPITWNAGDRLFAYNITSPRSDYDYLSVASDGFFLSLWAIYIGVMATSWRCSILIYMRRGTAAWELSP